MKKIFPAILGGATVLFGLGFLIYVVLGLNAQQGPLAEEVFNKLRLPRIILMEILYATLLTIIFSKWAHIETFSKGAVAGLIIGAFIGGCSTLEVFATSELINAGGVLLATVTFGVRFAVAGGVIGWVLGNIKENI